jgi:hypothetical protein
MVTFVIFYRPSYRLRHEPAPAHRFWVAAGKMRDTRAAAGRRPVLAAASAIHGSAIHSSAIQT